MNKRRNDPVLPISRLEQHAFAFRMNGLALAAVTTDGQAGPEPLWPLEQLTAAERAFLGIKFDEALARVTHPHGDEQVLRARVYAHVLHAHGIACPHPIYWRRQFSPDMFECLACEHLAVGAQLKRRRA